MNERYSGSHALGNFVEMALGAAIGAYGASQLACGAGSGWNYVMVGAGVALLLFAAVDHWRGRP